MSLLQLSSLLSKWHGSSSSADAVTGRQAILREEGQRRSEKVLLAEHPHVRKQSQAEQPDSWQHIKNKAHAWLTLAKNKLATLWETRKTHTDKAHGKLKEGLQKSQTVLKQLWQALLAPETKQSLKEGLKEVPRQSSRRL